MIHYQPYPTEPISIVPTRDPQADPRTSLNQLRARFARNEGLPFADVLTGPRIHDALDEHGVRYRDRVFSPVTTIWGFLSQVLSDDHSCRDAVTRIIAHRAATLRDCDVTLLIDNGRLVEAAGRGANATAPIAFEATQS